MTAELPIGLTTIRSPMHEMGVRAVHLLMRRLAGEAVASERLEPTLVVRESTLGPLPHATPSEAQPSARNPSSQAVVTGPSRSADSRSSRTCTPVVVATPSTRSSPSA